MTTPKYLKRADAAEHIVSTWGLPCSPKTLAKLAVQGGGPAFHKAGRLPLYAPAALDAWAEKKIGKPVYSTAEVRQAA